MSNSYGSYNPYPALHFYTRDEVADYLLYLLVCNRAGEISSTQVFTILPAIGYVIKSMSNNTIQGSYYGKRIDIHVAHNRLTKMIKERKQLTEKGSHS